MKSGFLQLSHRSLMHFLHGLGILAVFLFVTGGIFVWRMSAGPVDLAFAKPYVEAALKDRESGLHVKIGALSLAWPERKGPILFHMEEVSLLKEEAGTSALSVDDVDLRFSYPHLLLGRVRPVSLILQSPSVLLVRRDGNIDFFIQDQEITGDTPKEKPQDQGTSGIKEEVIRFFEKAADPKFRKMTVFEALRNIEIRQARAFIRDYEQGTSWYLSNLNFYLREQKEGIHAFLGLSLPSAADRFAGVKLDLMYRYAQKDFTLSANIHEMNPVIFSKFLPEDIRMEGQDFILNGEILAGLDQNLNLQEASVKLDIPEGTLDLPDHFDHPITLKNLSSQLAYAGGKKLSVRSFKADINNVSFDGQGEALFEAEKITAPLSLQVKTLPLEAFPPFFPKSEKDGEAAEWLLHRLSGGGFSDVSFKTTLLAEKEEAGSGWGVKTSDTLVDFSFDGVDVKYSDSLMPAKKGKGTGRFDFSGDRLEINGEYAEIGDVTGRNAKLVFTDILVAGGGMANISFEAAGPLSTAFKYISDEPIAMGDTLGFDVNGVKGRIDMAAQLNFPTIKDVPKEQVDVKVQATLTEVTIPKVVEGLDLTGGPLKLETKEGAFFVNGDGKLDGRDVTLDWTQYFDPAGKPFESQIKAQIVTDQSLRNHFGIALDEYMSGPLPVDVVYTDRGDRSAVIQVTGDLAPLEIHIDPFDYKKPSGTAGTLSLKAFLTKGVLKEIQNLNLETNAFLLSDTRLIFAPMNGKQAELRRGTAKKAVIGATHMTSLDFEVTGQDILKVSASGPVLDAQPFTSREEKEKPSGEKQQPMMISVRADKMITKDDRSLKNTNLYVETDRQGDMTRLEMDAVAGSGQMYIRFKPDAAGKRTFRMEAEDAGAFLYAMDLYSNARGGTLLIYGEPRGRNLYGDLDGVARIENFHVVKAPALAKLLSVMSLSGVQSLLDKEGLSFSKLESNFEWRFRPGGNLLILKDGRTSGSSIGLTFEGTVDQRDNTTDIRGTLIPMTEVNSLLSSIPLVGEILTGGSGLIAATYTMKGPSKDPQVSVNPLSILTPGFLRKILFEGGFEGKAPGE